MSKAKLIYLDTNKEAFINGLKNLVSMAEKDELTGMVAIGIQGKGQIIKFRGGKWRDQFYSIIGALRSLEKWLFREEEEL